MGGCCRNCPRGICFPQPPCISECLSSGSSSCRVLGGLGKQWDGPGSSSVGRDWTSACQAHRCLNSHPFFLMLGLGHMGISLVRYELIEPGCFDHLMAELLFLGPYAFYFALEKKFHCVCLWRTQLVSSLCCWIHQHSLTNKETGSMLDTHSTQFCTLSLCNPSGIDQESSGTRRP